MEEDGDKPNQAFSIVCENEETIVVSESQARKIFMLSEFFRNAFKHNTRESEERIVRKPDWSIGTAHHIIEYLTKLKTSFHFDDDQQAIFDFVAATQQILVGWRIRCPFHEYLYSHDIEKEQTAFLLRTVCHSKSKFHVSASVCGLIGQALLMKHILLSDAATSSIVFNCRKPEEVAMAMKRWVHTCQLLVTSIHPMEVAVAIVCGVLHEAYKIMDARTSSRYRRPRVFTEETVSIRVLLLEEPRLRHGPADFATLLSSPAGFFSTSDFHEVLNDMLSTEDPLGEFITRCAAETGACVFSSEKQSPGYYLTGYCAIQVTMSGSFEQLRSCWDLFRTDLPSILTEKLDNKYTLREDSCSLRVTAPTRATMRSLVTASRFHCSNHPGTLGVDFKSNAMYAIKSVTDITSMLSFLSSSTSKIAQVEDSTKDDNTTATADNGTQQQQEQNEFHLIELKGSRDSF